MSLDIEQIVKGMLEAAGEVLGDEGPKLRDELKKVLEEQKEALKEIAEARLRDEINDDDLRNQLEDEKEAFEAGLSMVKAVSKATIQKALNAALEIFWNAIKA